MRMLRTRFDLRTVRLAVVRLMTVNGLFIIYEYLYYTVLIFTFSFTVRYNIKHV